MIVPKNTVPNDYVNDIEADPFAPDPAVAQTEYVEDSISRSPGVLMTHYADSARVAQGTENVLNKAAARAAAYLRLDPALASAELSPETYDQRFRELSYKFATGTQPDRASQIESIGDQTVRRDRVEEITGLVGSGRMTPAEGAIELKKLGELAPLTIDESVDYYENAPETPETQADASPEDLEWGNELSEVARNSILARYGDIEGVAALRAEWDKEYGDVTKGEAIGEWIWRIGTLFPEVLDYAQIAYDTGNFASTLGGVLAGELRSKLRDQVRAAVREGKGLEVAKELDEVIKARAGTFGTTDTLVEEFRRDVLLPALENPNAPDTDWDRILMNTLGLVPGLMIAGRAVRLGARGLTAVSTGVAVRAKHKDFTRALDKAFKSPDPAAALAALKLTPDEVLRATTTVKPGNSVPNGMADMPAWREYFSKEEVLDLVDRYYFPEVGADVESLVQTARKTLESEYATISGGVLRQNISAFERISFESGRVTSVFGRTAAAPYANVAAAEKFADSLRAARPDALVEVIEVPAVSAKAKPKYLVQASEKVSARPEDIIMFGTNGQKPVINTPPGPRWLSNLWLSPESRYTGEMVGTAAARLLEGGNVANEVAALTAPVRFLSTPSRNKVWSVLQEGDLNGKQWNLLEAVTVKGLSPKEALGYLAMRNMSDVTWHVNDRRLRETLFNEGYESVTLRGPKAGKDVVNFGSIREGEAWLKGTGNGSRIYNTSAGKGMSKAEAQALVDAGTHIVMRLQEPLTRGRKSTYNYVITAKGSVDIKPLPPVVLRYDEGYVPRMANTPFRVMRVTQKLEDGVIVKSRELVTLPATAKLMSAKVDELMLGRSAAQLKDGVTYEGVNLAGRKGTQAYNDGADLIERPQLIFTKRDANSVLTKAENAEMLADPFEAMQRALTSTMRGMTWDNFMTTMDRSFFASFSDIFGDGAPLAKAGADYRAGKIGSQRLQQELEELKSSNGLWHADLAKQKRVNEALDLRYYYENLAGVVDRPNQEVYRNALLGAAVQWNTFFDWVGLPSVGTKGAIGFERLVGSDPSAFLRSFPFVFQIAGNPGRQFNLQTMQFLFAHGTDPRAGTISIQAVTAFRWEQVMKAAKPGWKLTDEAAGTLGKTMGISGDDYKALSKAFNEAGAQANIGSYNYYAPGLFDLSLGQTKSGFATVAQIAKNNLLSRPHSLIRDVGFTAGEINNQMMTFALAANRHALDSKKSFSAFTRADWNKISGKTATLSLSMNPAGQPLYHQGFLGTFTQFWSVQQKAQFAMLPTFVGGSRAFTPAQKAKLASAQLITYGPYGVGLGKWAHDWARQFGTEIGADLSPEQQEFLADAMATGLFEPFYNRLMSEMTDSRVRVSGFASDYAPASGFGGLVTDFAELLMGGTISIEDFGAFGSFMERTSNTMAQAGMINRLYRQNVVDTPEALKRQVQNLLTMYSGFNNATKAYYNMEIGKIAAKTGALLTDSNFAEEFGRMMFGTTPKEEAEMRRYMDLLSTPEGRKQAQDDRTRDLIKQLETFLVRSGRSGGGSPEAVIRDTAARGEAGMAVLNSMIDLGNPADHDQTIAALRKWIVGERPDEYTVAKKFFDNIQEGGEWDATERTRRILRDSELLQSMTPEQQSAIDMEIQRRMNEISEVRQTDSEVYGEENRNRFKEGVLKNLPSTKKED